MLKIFRDAWASNEDKLREAIKEIPDIHDISYCDLIKLLFLHVYNAKVKDYQAVNVERVTEIDDGDYQGTLIFLIPFDTYQPDASEYLMTYVGYGSCSGCDTLQHIQSNGFWGEKPTESQINDLLTLCRDMACNTIKPYNYGWRHDDNFDQVEFKEEKEK